MSDLDIVTFEGLQTPVSFKSCQNLLPILASVLRDWPFTAIFSGTTLSPLIEVEKVNNGYQRRSMWQEKPVVFRDPVDAVCGLIVDLIHAFIAEQKNPLCLHGAALEVNSGLMIFPNTYRVGKSLLSLKLVSCGMRLFSDDVLPIGDNGTVGVALGILPRLRLPLPEAAGKALTEYVEARPGPQSRRYRYVQLGEESLAARGSQAPVSLLINLRRSAGARPSLRPAQNSEMVRDMILRNFSQQNPSVTIVDQIHALVEKAQCFTLDYDSLDQAAWLLMENFGLSRVLDRRRTGGENLNSLRFQQSQGIVARCIDDAIFLVNPRDDSIFYLNSLGAGVWQLLGEPVSHAEAIATVQQAFPAIPPERIAADVSELIDQLLGQQLIEAL